MEKPLFQFIHASDPHWGKQSDQKFALAGERAACFLGDVRSLQPTPQFMLLTGDLASDANGRPEELTQVTEQLATLPMPTWVVPGNHDLSPGPRSEKPDAKLYVLEQTNWYRHFGNEGIFWVRRAGPLEFIGFALRNNDPDGTLDRLQAHLETLPLPSHPWRVVVGHYPIHPSRSGGTLSRWGMQHIEDSVPRVRELLQRHSQTVVAYLFGHIHALSAQVVDGVLHASGGAIAVGAPGYRIMSVYSDRLTSQFVPISDATLAEFAFWGGSRRESVTDESHETPEIYHSGTDVEQNFSFDFTARQLLPYEAK